MSLFKQWPFFPASCLDQVLITQERPKQRHFKQRHRTKIVSHGNSGFPAELLFSCCKSLYTIRVPVLLSLPCGEVSCSASFGTQAVTAQLGFVAEVQSRAVPGSCAVPWLGAQPCPEQPAGPWAGQGSCCSNCCRPAKGNQGLFCYLYLWERSNTKVKSRLILSFLYIKASTQSRCSQIYYPLYCSYWF